VSAFTIPPFGKVQVLQAYAGSQILQQPQGDLTVAVGRLGYENTDVPKLL
jgi:hypothetical protein